MAATDLSICSHRRSTTNRAIGWAGGSRARVLGEFVDGSVEVIARAWPAALHRRTSAVAEALPDFHGKLRHLRVNGGWLSAHMLDPGTHPGGRAVSTHAFAVFRLAEGRIAEVWGDFDHKRLIRDQVAGSGDRAPAPGRGAGQRATYPPSTGRATPTT
jgi:hypothetical protein